MQLPRPAALETCCPLCGGGLRGVFVVAPEGGEAADARAVFHCVRCGGFRMSEPARAVLHLAEAPARAHFARSLQERRAAGERGVVDLTAAEIVAMDLMEDPW
ncbi:MAG: hypothetical protein H6736_10460 [Alphaproteobacteria bacterium]|nr:hypothetical protein [Alphaproteobacteria bacterium]